MHSHDSLALGGVFNFPMNINSNHWVLGSLTMEPGGPMKGGEIRIRDPLGNHDYMYQENTFTMKACVILTE